MGKRSTYHIERLALINERTAVGCEKEKRNPINRSSIPKINQSIALTGHIEQNTLRNLPDRLVQVLNLSQQISTINCPTSKSMGRTKSVNDIQTKNQSSSYLLRDLRDVLHGAVIGDQLVLELLIPDAQSDKVGKQVPRDAHEL